MGTEGSGRQANPKAETRKPTPEGRNPKTETKPYGLMADTLRPKPESQNVKPKPSGRSPHFEAPRPKVPEFCAGIAGTVPEWVDAGACGSPMTHINMLNGVDMYASGCMGMYTCSSACMQARIHYITLHYITLHCIALHYITLHYITLH